MTDPAEEASGTARSSRSSWWRWCRPRRSSLNSLQSELGPLPCNGFRDRLSQPTPQLARDPSVARVPQLAPERVARSSRVLSERW